MLTRRQFLIGAAGLVLWPSGCTRPIESERGIEVNDLHSRLNPSRLARIDRPRSLESVQRLVRTAAREGMAVSIAGGRHAMGGQQFGTGTLHLDMTGLNRLLGLDSSRGLVMAEAGIQWPQLMDELLRAQEGQQPQWGINQKQTGADRLSLGGALAANVHGRGLRLKPFIADVESFTLVDADGTLRQCSRTENTDLFRLAIGGYGLFGVITTVVLRLTPRRKLTRVVELIDVEALMPAFEQRVQDGYLFGDFQYTTDPASDEFLRKGVFSCYQPVNEPAPIAKPHKELSADDWRRLYYLGHTDKSRAFHEYADYYLSTSGQLYWSDTHQLSLYLDDYHRALDRRLGTTVPGTEMITEIYVPRRSLARFLEDVRADFRTHRVNVIYGTIRLIEQDDESVLAWAREPWACIIFNLHVDHSRSGLEHASQSFRRLIDLAVTYGGSYYLTYHRWATRRQVDACYPQFAEFLRLKRTFDREERFQSDWYRHYREMFADVL